MRQTQFLSHLSQWKEASWRVEELTESDVEAFSIDDSQLVMLQLESGNCLRFQADTGAHCNVIPPELYKKAITDMELKKVTLSKTKISAYGGSRLPVVSQVIIPVWRNGKKFKLDCHLVDNTSVQPILGLKACLGMKILHYMDNDKINKPDTGNAPVYAMNDYPPDSLKQGDIVSKFS